MIDNMKRYKVYCLKDKQGNIKYIGQTRQSLEKRRQSHRNQSHFKDEFFTIELIADFDYPEPMYKLEAMLIEQYDLVNKGWNKSLGYVEGKCQVSQAGENNQFFGQKHGPETIEKLRQNSLGNSNAKGNPSRRGMKNSPSHQATLVEALNKPVMCLETGQVFKSGAEAAKKMGLQKSKICLVCKGIRKHTGGYRFVYVQKVK
jgi:hypothetical protein